MRQATLDEVGALAKQASAEIWRQARAAGRDPKIYLHWSAGRYTTPFADYHINILGDGTIMIPTDDFSDVLAHTWCRNTGAIGISLACAYGANTNNLGEYPPTSDQIENMACAIVKVADALNLTIDKQHVMTHGEAADNEDGIYCHEPYGPLNGCERWDLEYLGTPDSPRYNPRATDGSRGGDVLRGKANWYRDQENGVPAKQEEEEMRYKTIDEMPDWARPTVQKLMEKGILTGNGDNLDLSPDMVRLLVIHDRAGVYA